MADGTTKRIDQIRVGDRVISTNPDTGETSPQTVTATIVGNGEKTLIDITIETSRPLKLPQRSSVTATDGHPFHVKSTDSWVDAVDLKPGDELTTTTPGAALSVTSTSTRSTHTRVFNLTVANTHTYHVLAGRTPILVHNDEAPSVGTIVRQNSVTIQIYANDPGPPHAHVKDGGAEVRIGQNGKPLKDDPELTRLQREVVNQNIHVIRDNIRVAMARYKANAGC